MGPAQHPPRHPGADVRRAGRAAVAAGLLGLAVAGIGLWRDVGFIAQPFYAWAWWSYILLVDGLVALRRGGSLLTTRSSHLAPLALWSVSFWFFFELLNLRFRNWYYVGVFAARSLPEFLLGLAFGVVAFATVFVGLFETADLVGSLARVRALRLRPRRFPDAVGWVVQGLGAAMALSALLFPRWLAPLVWGSVGFLIDPWCYRRGARSLLGDVERGSVVSLARLLGAGLVCGVVWEGLNFLAPQKWIYTVRGLEELKLFEMPLLGFLGFPALALDAFAAFAAVSWLVYGNRTWEDPADVPPPPPAPRPAAPRRLRLALLPLHVVLWGAVSWYGQTRTIGSLELEVAQLEALPEGAAPALAAAGIRRPAQLLAALEDPVRRARVERTAGLAPAAAARVVEEVRLLSLKGIGAHHGRRLAEAGIRTVADLAAADPGALYRTLAMERSRRGIDFPALSEEMVRVWVRAARAAVPDPIRG